MLCVSKDTQKRYRNQAGAGKDNSVVLHNTVGDQFRPGDKHAARTKFGLGGEFVILTVGRLDPRRQGYKGHDRIISQLSALETGDGRKPLYLIAGDGSDRNRLESLTNELGVRERVRFLGAVADKDLPDLYRAADLFALPSTGEGFGIVFLEAMACGTPAIGLKVGGAVDALVQGELGPCVPEENFPLALQKLVLSAAPDPYNLHRKVTGRFGKGIFQQRLHNQLQPLVSAIRTQDRQL